MTESVDDRWYVYVDLDAFYVSCELRERPELAGKPVIVGPPPGSGRLRGVVLSASYEARAFGVRSAMPIGRADALCPDATWISPDFRKYQRVSEFFRELLGRFSSEVYPFSIDEAAIVVRGVSGEDAQLTAQKIQGALKAELALPSSLGISTTRVVAKIATDRAKPGGILLVPPGQVAEFLAPLSVRAIPGVGPKTEALLDAAGLKTISDLARRKTSELREVVGDFGGYLSALARGHPTESEELGTGARSRSAEHTFDRDEDRWSEIEALVRGLAEELARSLEQEKFRYATVGIAYRWSDFSRTQRSRTLGAAKEGTHALTDEAVRLARELFNEEQAARGRPIRTVSVRAERLEPVTQRQVRLEEF